MKRILVALDGSARASLVLQAAASLAELTGAKLVLFRSIGLPADVPREVVVQSSLRLEDVLRDTANAELANLAKTVRPQLVEGIETRIGTAWDTIVREARDLAADLIVIGSHGYSGIDRLLGTTAGKVANHADRNVLIVRMPL
jgi:nucleotide-binding universal stress UspA family protein